jgi:hypothetical protein
MAFIANMYSCRQSHGSVHDTSQSTMSCTTEWASYSNWEQCDWVKWQHSWWRIYLNRTNKLSPGPQHHHHWHSILWNPLRSMYHHHEKASRHAHEVCHHLAKTHVHMSPALYRICCTLHVLECAGPYPLQPRSVTVWLPWFSPQTRVRWRCQARSSTVVPPAVQRASISWCVNAMPTSMSVLTSFNSINKFTQNNPLTGFIWISITAWTFKKF